MKTDTKYEVVSRTTVEQMRAQYPMTAAEMERGGFVAYLGVRKPRGRSLLAAYETNDGRVSIITKV